jgi:hypothetical protein
MDAEENLYVAFVRREVNRVRGMQKGRGGHSDSKQAK